MGSLSPSGTKLIQPTNVIRFAHNGNFLIRNNTKQKTDTTVPNSGTVSTLGSGLAGVMFHPLGSTTHSSGMTLVERTANITSRNLELFLTDGSVSGVPASGLKHDVERAGGIFTTVSYRAASGALGPMETFAERKVFFLDSDIVNSGVLSAWTIFDADGNTVGTSTGTTDTDITPTGVYGV